MSSRDGMTRPSSTCRASGFKLAPTHLALRDCFSLIVKSPAELEAAVAEGTAKVLRGVYCKSVHETQVAGGPRLDDDMRIPWGTPARKVSFLFFLEKSRYSCH